MQRKREKVYTTWVKTTAGEDQNQYIRIASKISNNHLDFILTLNAENGLWTPDRISKPNRNGTRDYGFCQLNSTYHWNFIQSDGFKDPHTQLQYCWDLYKGYEKRGIVGKRFYGYNIRLKRKHEFILK